MGHEVLDATSYCYRIGNMEFEFDPYKSLSNRDKHGIDFLEAQAIWNDPYFTEIPARTTGEPRFMVIGKISGRYWSGIITYRSRNVRIISVRPSRREEIDIYENR